MTLKQKLMADHPEMDSYDLGYAIGSQCPSEYGYPEPKDACKGFCGDCWNSEMSEKKEEEVPISKELRDAGIDTPEKLRKAYGVMKNGGDANDILNEIRKDAEKVAGKPPMTNPITPETFEVLPTIKDSGDRTQFETGAVRDMREGKGRCDLMPLRVIAECYHYFSEGDELDEAEAEVFNFIADFQDTNDTMHLLKALDYFPAYTRWSAMFLEVAKHFEEGAKKYGENNWQKGIPVHCYIDSAIRHYLKWLRGDKDEPHDRAFCWNLMCCIWEVDYSPRANKEDS